MQRRRWLAGSVGLVVIACIVAPASAGCAPAAPEPAAAVMRTTPPPWDAPRDAVSYIEAAGLEAIPSGYRATTQTVAELIVEVDGRPVDIPAFIGIDRIRNVEAPLHTHQADGTVWIEHPVKAPTTTLGQFFDLWGVRFDDGCLGQACKRVQVRLDGKPLEKSIDPRSVEWTPDLVVQIDAES